MNHIKVLYNNLSNEHFAEESMSSHDKYPAMYSGELDIQDNFCEEYVKDKVDIIFKRSREKWSGLENISFCYGVDLANRKLKYCLGVSSENITFSAYVLDSIKRCLSKLENGDDVKLLSEDDSGEDEKTEQCSNESKYRKPKDLVQIHADSKTVKNWIDSFVKSRREVVNTQNIKEFCQPPNVRQNCARVDAVLVKRKDTSSHIRVEHVSNLWGPQIRDQFSPLKNKPAADEHNYSVSKRSYQSSPSENKLEPVTKKKIYSSQDVASKLEEFRMKYLRGSSAETKD